MSEANHTEARHWVLIPAAGIGKRMQASCPKQYLSLLGKSILEHTLSIFLDHPRFSGVFVGLSDGDPYWPELDLSRHQKVHSFIGGEERVDTVYEGLLTLSEHADDQDWVWVHDAARPCLAPDEIEGLFLQLNELSNGALLAVKIHDTVKYAGQDNRCEKTVDRDALWRAMTPQVFRLGQLRQALKQCIDQGVFVTDDASAMEHVGAYPVLVSGSSHNIKITRPEDLSQAEQFMRNQKVTNQMRWPRVGTGYDVHAFEEGTFVTLGGEKIPHNRGLKAHSDGDVLLHALTDALLGALALGDIGKHFPDTDPQWKGANSRELLKAVLVLVKNQGYGVGNVDVTVIAQEPKMAPFIEAIQDNIANDLGVDKSCVGVKATTTEKLGFTGRKEGIAAQATALLVPSLS